MIMPENIHKFNHFRTWAVPFEKTNTYSHTTERMPEQNLKECSSFRFRRAAGSRQRLKTVMFINRVSYEREIWNDFTWSYLVGIIVQLWDISIFGVCNIRFLLCLIYLVPYIRSFKVVDIIPAYSI